MLVARERLSNHVSQVVLTVFLVLATLVLATTATLKAQSSTGIAPLNVPGRYVSSTTPKKTTTPPKKTTANNPVTRISSPAGRYVSEPASASRSTARKVDGAANAPKVSPGRYVSDPDPTRPGVTAAKPAQSAGGSDLQTLSLIKAALPDLATVYGKRIRKNDASAVQAFYENRYNLPLWVNEKGLTRNGEAMVAELSDADNWGLSKNAFALPAPLGPTSSARERAQAELIISISALKYIHHARGGRVNPRSISRRLDRSRELLDPASILPALESSSEPDAYLRAQHPQHPQFKMLQKALKALRTPRKAQPAQPVQAKKKVLLPASGPTLKPGMSHPDVALLRKRLEVPALDNPKDQFDVKLQAALKKFQTRNGLSADAVVGPQTRRTLNGKPPRKPAGKKARIQKIVLNMERWRWMPRDPGEFYIFNNIPEFRTRIYSKGKVVYSEKIIVGKHKNPTPSFSADMLYVIFHPSWGVPNGIKRTEILPYLRQTTGFFGWGGADTRILKAHNLRVMHKGKPIDASKVNWSKVDIRNYTFIQPPSSTNVLGKVKFRFPNRHDVYMHDTPERHLFKQSVRAESHGCIRVKNPLRLAELILEQDKGWSSSKVGGYWKRGGSVTLEKPISVHTSYFTVFADDNGNIRTISDLYSFDSRVARAMGKTPLHVRPDAVSSASTDNDTDSTLQFKKPKKKKKKTAKKKKQKKQKETVADIIHSVLAP